MLTYIVLFLSSWETCLGLIGGTAAPNYPFFVRIEQNGVSCGGTLVSANAVVTAAGCILDATTRQ